MATAAVTVTLRDEKPREVWTGLLPLLAEQSGQPLERCYQCQKCSSGCPVAEFMDYRPSQVIRLAQLGLAEVLLAAGAPWTCAGCLVCGLRCPNGISVGHVMDTLKGWILAGTVPASVRRARALGTLRPGHRRAALFHRLFLGEVRALGRVHELSLMGLLKVIGGDLTSDLPAGMRMMAKGKLPLLPRLGPERREVAAMFERALIVRRRSREKGRGDQRP